MAAMRGSSKLPSPIASARRGWHNWALGLLCLIVVVAAITSIGSSSADSASTQRTATVERGVVQSTVSGNGSLEAAQQVELNFGTSGEVTEIDVEAGEKVSKGEVLARIDSSSARASLASAEAQLAEAEETLEAASEGEEVSASYEGTATVSVATAEAKLRQAQLSVKSARQEVRETALRAPISGTIASVSGSVGETVSGEGSAAGGGSGIESGAASTGGLGADGSSDSSSSSSSSSAFIVLSQLSRLKMEVSFSESDIGKVKAGQPATVSVSSMEGTELAGRVTKVNVLPSEASSSGVVEYPATITITQSAKGVRAGMSASAEVVVEQVSNALSVTSEAISSGPGGGSVTVLEDGKEVEHNVTTGLKGDETTQILSGVKAGETVVLPEITAAAGGEGPAGGLGEGGAFPGGGSLPSFGSGGPPSGFPGAP